MSFFPTKKITDRKFINIGGMQNLAPIVLDFEKCIVDKFLWKNIHNTRQICFKILFSDSFHGGKQAWQQAKMGVITTLSLKAMGEKENKADGLLDCQTHAQNALPSKQGWDG